MFWGISEAWWMQIWSGVLGATVAAGVSIFVALIVVQKTNAHQSVLSARALAEQRKRDAEVLAEQRARDAKALEVQREALQEQLNEQRKESNRLRMMDIRADVMTAASHLMEAARGSREAVDQARLQLDKAINRWRIESDDEDLIDELMYWPNFAGNLASNYQIALLRKDAAAEEIAFDRLNDAVSMLSVVSVHLPRSKFIPLEKLHLALRELRQSVKAAQAKDAPNAGQERPTPIQE